MADQPQPTVNINEAFEDRCGDLIEEANGLLLAAREQGLQEGWARAMSFVRSLGVDLSEVIQVPNA